MITLCRHRQFILQTNHHSPVPWIRTFQLKYCYKMPHRTHHSINLRYQVQDLPILVQSCGKSCHVKRYLHMPSQWFDQPCHQTCFFILKTSKLLCSTCRLLNCRQWARGKTRTSWTWMRGARRHTVVIKTHETNAAECGRNMQVCRQVWHSTMWLPFYRSYVRHILPWKEG